MENKDTLEGGFVMILGSEFPNPWTPEDYF